MVADSPCFAWQWDEAASSCTIDKTSYAQGANHAGVDSGLPGSFTSSKTSVVFSTSVNAGAKILHNALGEQGFFVLAGHAAAGVTSAASSAASIETLLATLKARDPSAALLGSGDLAPAAGDLFAAASVTASGVPPGQSVSLSLAHAWHYPHFFWFRDRFSGSDNGVRYTSTYADVHAVAASIDLNTTTQQLLDWQRVFIGLPDPLLRDGVMNLFNHVRSAIWHGGDEQQYRQWESFEFSDWSNPTNGDERHLPYFHYLPETMKSKLMTEINHLEHTVGPVKGMFPCVVVSGASDHQLGIDPCLGSIATHPDDITMVRDQFHDFLLKNSGFHAKTR